MAVAKVQYTYNSSASTPVSAVYGSTPTQNNLLVAIVWNNIASTSLAVTGFTSIKDQNFGTANSIAVWAKIAGASESTTVTATSTGAPTAMRLAIWEFSGSVTTSAADAVYLSNSASSAAVTSVLTSSITFTTGAEAEYCITGMGFNASTTAWAVDNGFTIETGDGRMSTAYKAISSSGSQSTTWTWTTSRTNGHVIAGIKAYVAPAPTSGGTGLLMGVG
jgi:hypothetical protein